MERWGEVLTKTGRLCATRRPGALVWVHHLWFTREWKMAHDFGSRRCARFSAAPMLGNS